MVLTFWAKLLTWQQVAETFRVSWGTVFTAVERAVEWGLARRDLTGIGAIGVDEVQWQRGHVSFHQEGFHSSLLVRRRVGCDVVRRIGRGGLTD
ncbi:MAG: hypothetical protein L0Y71_06070, partial [Gemmataceae bacterium]|nr:hypothetical protein [Gemmataceae bacterium]